METMQDSGFGLTSQEVEKSRELHGNNIITPAKEQSAWELFLEKFKDPIIEILLVAAALSLVVAFIDGEFTETIGIICAVILATGVGFLFEWDAMRRFKRMNRVNDEIPVRVRRNGEVVEIPRRDVVVGDYVYVESGEMIPADGVLLEAVSLRVDESTLTGESECRKSANPEEFDSEATYPTSHLLRGTTVIEGYGAFVVERVGDSSEAGRVTEQSTVKSGDMTPLERQLQRLSNVIGKVGFSVAGAIFIILVGKAVLLDDLLQCSMFEISREILHIFMVAVAVIVMAVPEGLPMSITLSLAMSMRRMLKTNNLVRKLHACETMGAVTVICTDKTGTLTRNRMTVERVNDLAEYSADDMAIAIACNTTAFLDGDFMPLGNPTEGALLSWLHNSGYDYAKLRAGHKLIDRIPFSTQHKYMATLVEVGSKRVLIVKGAPEIVADMSLADFDRGRFDSELLKLQQRAMRTLAVAWCESDKMSCEEAIADGKLSLKATFAISDPVREDVPKAVAKCLRAGVKIKIVTGDTAATATEIARQIGLWSDETDKERNRMTGVEFSELSDEELLERVEDLKILSRARPLDKQRLVRLLQRRGEVVAVTGDGTNDAPALNFADVGLSMGSGTSVAKDASDITLLDDSFASIVSAIKWGRSLYRNIQRFVLFQLTINVVAIAVVVFGSLFGAELPLTVVQMLWVNLIMDTFAAMAMASLPPTDEVLEESPRSADSFIISRDMARVLFSTAALFIAVLLGLWGYWYGVAGELTIRELTIFFTLFIFLQFWNMFNAKGFMSRHSALRDTKGFRTFYAVLLMIGAGQILIVEWGGELFRTQPLLPMEWLKIVAATSVVAIGGELLRMIRRRGVGR